MRPVKGDIRALVIAVAALAALAAPAHAQEQPAESDAPDAAAEEAPPRSDEDDDATAALASDAEVEGAEGHAPDPTRVAAAEELPEGADFGPPMLHRRRDLTPEEARRERERRADASEPLMPGVFQLFLGVGAALDSSLTGALIAHRYADTPVVFQGDATFLGRVTEWLYIGGRLGGRGRGWGSNDAPPAIAGGIDLMAVAHARAYLGRIVDLGAVLGAGIGWAGLTIQGAPSTGFAPRLHGGVVLGFRLAPGVRFAARFAWDWFSLYDLDRYGSDLDIGGPALSVGLEVRR
jgi:hypothetical protein